MRQKVKAPLGPLFAATAQDTNPFISMAGTESLAIFSITIKMTKKVIVIACKHKTHIK